MATLFVRTVAAIMLSGAAFATPSVAAADGASATVRYADLDLATPGGETALQTRIRHAAEQVCGDVDQRDLGAVNAVAACRKVAMASAAPQVEVALADARSGRAYAANDLKIRRGF